MDNLCSKVEVGIRYIDNFNGTVTMRKSDFESLVQQVNNSEKDTWEDFKNRNGIKNSGSR